MSSGKAPVYGPGGGGGAGVGAGANGGNGSAGLVEISYTAGTAPSANILRFLMHVPAAGDTNNAAVMWMDTNGTLAKVGVTYTTASSGSLTLTAYNSGGTLLFTGTPITGVNGLLLMVSIELFPSGSTILAALECIIPGASSAYQAQSGTVSGTNTLGAVTGYHSGTVLAENAPSGLVGTSIGHIVVQYELETLTSVSQALNGYIGELAATRFQRLLGEEGIPFTLIGNLSDTEPMGAQPDDKLINVLQQTEDLDQGLMFEPRNSFGLGYRTYLSMTNQNPGLVADYSQAHVSPPFQPTEDDQLTRNIVTITRTGGSSYVAQVTTGPLSTQNPPNGVGQYTYSLTVNAQTDTQLPATANPILALGTVDDYRYPQVTFDLSRPELQQLFEYLTQMQVGDRLQIVNPPSFLTATSIDQLAYGFTLDISGFKYTFEINCVPEAPFET